MSSVRCPLCSVSLATASLETHLRTELGLPALRCLLCPVAFVSADRALAHFAGPLPAHPGQPPQLLDLPGQPDKEQRLRELARLALGGPQEVEKRLCVCGRCRLECREAAAAPASTPLKAAAAQLIVLAKAEAEDPMPEEEDAADEPAPESAPGLQEALQPFRGLDTETPAAVDVKPSLGSLQPGSPSDGKVACLLCGVRAAKDGLKRHAVQAHSSAKPYSCLLCPWSEKSRAELGKHQRREHEVGLSAESFSFVGSEEGERALVGRCFGAAAEDADYVRLRCQPCDKPIAKAQLKNHVAANHLKKALHACRLCDYTTVRFKADMINDHVKRRHPGHLPGPDTVDSAAALHFGPIIKGMIAQLFV